MTADDRLAELVARTLKHLGGFVEPPGSSAADFAVEAGEFESPKRNWAIVSLAGQRHPLVDGVLYCRRGAKLEQCLDILRVGDRTAALTLLLNDRDAYDRQPPAEDTQLRRLVEAVDRGSPPPMYAAMRTLQYGPVADYFAIRPATPTFLSGLGLLALTAGGCGRVTDVGCGIGQFLWWLQRSGFARCGGIDVVFSKLWLARQYLIADVPLAAIDVVDTAVRYASDVVPSPIQEQSESIRHLIFCHDVFYFLRSKAQVLRYFRDAAGPAPRIAIGHTHQRDVDPNASGDPCTAQEYAELFRATLGSEAAAYDDADLFALTLRGDRPATRAPDELSKTPALSFVWPSADLTLVDDLHRVDGHWPVVLNPQLRRDLASGRWAYRWPNPQFEAEYRDADYLSIDAETSQLIDCVGPRLPCRARDLVARAPAASHLLARKLLLPVELACETIP